MTVQTVQGYPTVKVWWVRGWDREFIKFRNCVTYLVLGPKDSGKSAYLEAIAVQGQHDKIIDLFGSRDNEGLAWCRSPFKDKVLFVVGDTMDVKSQWDTKRVSDLRLHHFRKYKVILSVSSFHPSIDAEFEGMSRVVDVLWNRLSWQKPWCLMIREASSYLYSRIKKGKRQDEAKADLLYLLREIRHMGIAVGVDTLRWTGVDADLRGPCDYVIIKRVGIEGLPNKLRWIYGRIAPHSLMNPHQRIYTVVSNKGPLGVGTFDLPYWHKRKKENLLDILGIKIDRGEAPDYGDQSRNTVNDYEHIRIVKAYFDDAKLKGSMHKVAQAFTRSPSTIRNQIKFHDDMIGSLGECPRCRRVRGELSKTPLLHDKRQIGEVYTDIDAFMKTWKQ